MLLVPKRNWRKGHIYFGSFLHSYRITALSYNATCRVSLVLGLHNAVHNSTLKIRCLLALNILKNHCITMQIPLILLDISMLDISGWISCPCFIIWYNMHNVYVAVAWQTCCPLLPDMLVVPLSMSVHIVWCNGHPYCLTHWLSILLDILVAHIAWHTGCAYWLMNWCSTKLPSLPFGSRMYRNIQIKQTLQQSTGHSTLDWIHVMGSWWRIAYLQDSVKKW